ncbi:MAG: diacylglycerol/lipid kinase family protein [Methyloligella sp. ZOD6]
MRALLMHNPTAGDGDDSKTRLCEGLKASGYEPVYFSTKEEAYKEAARTEKADLIAIAGGDGTVSKVLCEVTDRRIPIAILPAGTANNVARSLNIEGAPEVLAARLADAPSAQLDIGIATGPWGERRFLEGIGFGAFAWHMEESSGGDTREEKIAAGRQALRDAIEAAEPEWFEIDVDGHKLVGDFLFVEVINIGCTGPGLTLSSEAQSGDKLLDIVYLPSADREKMVAWLDREAPEAPIPLKRVQGNRVAVTTEGGTLRRDDNVWLQPEKAQIVRIAVEDEPFRVLVPRATG